MVSAPRVTSPVAAGTVLPDPVAELSLVAPAPAATPVPPAAAAAAAALAFARSPRAGDAATKAANEHTRMVVKLFMIANILMARQRGNYRNERG